MKRTENRTDFQISKPLHITIVNRSFYDILTDLRRLVNWSFCDILNNLRIIVSSSFCDILANLRRSVDRSFGPD